MFKILVFTVNLQGFREKYSKDEQKKSSSFYSKGNKSGDYNLFGEENDKHGSEKGDKYSGSSKHVSILHIRRGHLRHLENVSTVYMHCSQGTMKIIGVGGKLRIKGTICPKAKGITVATARRNIIIGARSILRKVENRNRVGQKEKAFINIYRTKLRNILRKNRYYELV